MSRNDSEWTLVWPRKLTTEETTELQQRLRPLFSEGEEDDIQDIIDYAITVISNQKDINYMVEEIAGMELEFCPPEVSNEMGRHVFDYLQELQSGNSSQDTTTSSKGGEQNQQESSGTQGKSHVVSLKSSKGNALTMSGALGASRERNSKNTTPSGALTSSREGGRKDSSNTANRDKKNRISNTNDPEKRSGGRGERRDDKGLAFDRLADKRAQNRQSSNGDDHRGPRGRGEDRNDRMRNNNSNNRPMNDRNNSDGGRRGGPRDGPGRGGRGGGGRGERDFGGRVAGGGAERGRGGRGGDRDMGDRGGRSAASAGGRGGREFRGGRNEEFDGRGRHSGSRRKHDDEGYDDPGSHKRVRRDEQGHKEGGYDGGYTEGYDESYEHAHHVGHKQAHWQSPAFRGRGRGHGGRFGRGSPAGRGGFGKESYTESSEVDLEAVAVNPSPMVADTFGRGFAGRGSFRGRGRGFYPPAYDHVKNMMKAKTWVRKKEGEENGNDGETGGGEQVEES